jgi:hypothetical protein
MTVPVHQRFFPLALLGLAALGCGSTLPETADRSLEIIGGFDASSAAFDAVGALVILDEVGQPVRLCTATLVTPTAVITAKHCILESPDDGGGPRLDQQPVFFALGPDAKAPYRMVRAIHSDASPIDEGGWSEFSDWPTLGHDLGVYHLDEPINEIDPLAVGGFLSSSDIGTRFIAMGYGRQHNRDGWEPGTSNSTRRMGLITLRALEGRPFELMFGTLQAFLDNQMALMGPLPDEEVDALTHRYEKTFLIEGHEAWLGARPGDAQACNGDSGSPLLARVEGALHVLGVLSGGWSTPELRCDRGNIYATLGPRARDYLAASLAYEDPCGSLPETGGCAGTRVLRCTSRHEGPRRVVDMDCAAVGMQCGYDAERQATCVAP